MKKIPSKNRGSISNPEGRFETITSESFDDGWYTEEEESVSLETQLISENAKSIISKNDSPDISFDQSINPYRGCEHGCIYCYARPSHEYLNLSSGIDFETKIFYKNNAAKLLEEEINKPKYQCKTIVLGANTDPYQPAEAKLKITRSLLEVLYRYKHPINIISKNTLILRDLDILQALAEEKLVKVALSITTLSKDLKHLMEPRTSTPAGRLKALQTLVEHNVPVRVMVAPIIPIVNDKELEHILKSASEAGAKHASYVLIRLPYQVKDLFKEWLKQHFPQRAEHVMSIIRQTRNGKEYDAQFGKRMVGEGEFAKLIATRFHLACKRFQLNMTPDYSLDFTKFSKRKNHVAQLDLWENLEF